MRRGPVLPFVLVLIGGIIGIISAGTFFIEKSIIAQAINNAVLSSGHYAPKAISFALSFLTGLFAWFIVAGVILIVSSFMIYSGEVQTVRTGGILAILFGIFSLMNGMFIPLILGIIGGALAISWSKDQREQEELLALSQELENKKEEP